MINPTEYKVKRLEKIKKEYYKNPNFCLYCNKIIEPKWEKYGGKKSVVSDARRNIFCSLRCSGIFYNTGGKNRLHTGGKNRLHTGRLWKTDDNVFTEIVKTSLSVAEIIVRCGYKGMGVRAQIKKRINDLNLNTSHILGQGHKKIKL